MNTSHTDQLKRFLEKSIEAKQALLQDQEQLGAFDRAMQAIIACYRQGGRLYIAGNGGSAADAQHLAAELVCRFGKERPALPAEAFTVDSSILTAIANDYGYEHIFSRQVEGKMQPGDLFLAITTSGNSPNILRALERCRAQGLTSILLSGHQGGRAAALADHVILAKGAETGTIQEQHIVIIHALCHTLEQTLFG
ncbi:D-sedoheptulose-7-phosphate isomerase [Sedimenticola hydrogenitrophicus]|uniref:D-sedoheptulose-7-phosphate isomerase n=1 Tax=Sedimenticola hydrogenitrophicus TaxID=2967975 RepID=UPI0021A65FD9|nr:SIS domain-containing protein [Sedimenticola hydrogenitrophicus]